MCYRKSCAWWEILQAEILRLCHKSNLFTFQFCQFQVIYDGKSSPDDNKSSGHRRTHSRQKYIHICTGVPFIKELIFIPTICANLVDTRSSASDWLKFGTRSSTGTWTIIWRKPCHCIWTWIICWETIWNKTMFCSNLKKKLKMENDVLEIITMTSS